jgi:hypothetical protein
VNASEAVVGKYEPDHRKGKGGNFEWVPFRSSMKPKNRWTYKWRLLKLWWMIRVKMVIDVSLCKSLITDWTRYK